MSVDVNLKHQVGNIELGTALGAVNTGRKALLALSIPMEVEWQSTIVDRFHTTIDNAAEQYQAPQAGTVVHTILDLEKAGILTRWSEPTLDSLGRRTEQKRIRTPEGWELISSLAGNLGGLSLSSRHPLAALVGEVGQKPNGQIEIPTIAARVAIYTDLLTSYEDDKLFTTSPKLAEKANIHNARCHVEDLLRLGVLDYAKTDSHQTYSLADLRGIDVESVVMGDPARTKPEVIQLRERILLYMAQGSRSRVDVLSYLNKYPDHPASRFIQTLSPDSARRRIDKELQRFERHGVLMKALEVGTVYKICINGIAIARSYMEILQKHAQMTGPELKNEARHYHHLIGKKGSELATWLAHSDYTTSKFKNQVKPEEKDAILADALATKSKTVSEISKEVGVLNEQVVRIHLAKSDRFRVTGKDGTSNLWQPAN